jgi:hypothetical protein
VVSVVVRVPAAPVPVVVPAAPPIVPLVEVLPIPPMLPAPAVPTAAESAALTLSFAALSSLPFEQAPSVKSAATATPTPV